MNENIIILTGGSRGIGHATSKKFWEEGWRVITCSRSEVAPQCPWEKNKTDHFQIDLEDLDDLRKKVKIPILSMPEEVYNHTKKNCKINSQIGILATEATLNTKIYHKYFNKRFKLLQQPYKIQKKNVNKAIKFVKMGNVRKAEKIIKPAIDYLIKINCKKIILGCTELPIAIFAFKSFKKAKKSKIFIDPNLILANTCVNKYKAA